MKHPPKIAFSWLVTPSKDWDGFVVILGFPLAWVRSIKVHGVLPTPLPTGGVQHPCIHFPDMTVMFFVTRPDLQGQTGPQATFYRPWCWTCPSPPCSPHSLMASCQQLQCVLYSCVSAWSVKGLGKAPASLAVVAVVAVARGCGSRGTDVRSVHRQAVQPSKNCLPALILRRMHTLSSL